MNDNNVSSGGVGILGVLQIIFIVLKLVGVIHWRWVVVLLPFWIALGLIAIVFIVLFIIDKWGDL